MTDKESKKAKWEELGISQDLYQEIIKSITPDIIQSVKAEVKKELTEANTPKKQPMPSDFLIPKNKKFKVALGRMTGMWNTPGRSIVLSIFPAPGKKEGNWLSDPIDINHKEIDAIKKGIDIGVITVAAADAEIGQIKSTQLTKGVGRDNESMSTIPESVKTLLNNNESTVTAKIKEVNDVPVLKVLLNLERTAQNSIGRTRPNVLAAINNQIRVAPMNGNVMGGMMIDSEVTEEMPEEDEKLAV